VSSKRQLAARGEDPEPVVGSGRGRRENEGCLGQVGPAGDGLHGGRVQALGIEHHGDHLVGSLRHGLGQ